MNDKTQSYEKFMLSALNRSLKTAINILDIEKEDVDKKELLTISKFAKLCNVPISTIRYWVGINKIIPISYTESGYMLFSKQQKRKLK